MPIDDRRARDMRAFDRLPPEGRAIAREYPWTQIIEDYRCMGKSWAEIEHRLRILRSLAHAKEYPGLETP